MARDFYSDEIQLSETQAIIVRAIAAQERGFELVVECELSGWERLEDAVFMFELSAAEFELEAEYEMFLREWGAHEEILH